MTDEQLTAEQVAAITVYVDTEALPPDEPTAHFIFGTNQVTPVEIVAERYHRGLAPLVIATGGVNRHNGIVEGREFRTWLMDRGVPETAIRVEDESGKTWQNVEFALPHLREALDADLRVTALCKWYHRRAVHAMRKYLPEEKAFYVITWDPIYAGKPVTRDDWPTIPDGRRRVLREWEEVRRSVSDGSIPAADRIDGAWK